MTKNNHTTAWLVAGIVAAAIVLDQALKIYIKLHFTLGETYEVLPFFDLCFIENNGMAFGIEWFDKLFLTLFRIVAVGLLVWYIIRLIKSNARRAYIVMVTLVLAGALGNIIDCLFYGVIFNESTVSTLATMFPDGGGYAPFLYGRVVDMIYVKLFPIPSGFPVWGGTYFFPAIFNFADSCVTVGVALLIIFNKRVFKEERVEEDGVKE